MWGTWQGQQETEHIKTAISSVRKLVWIYSWNDKDQGRSVFLSSYQFEILMCWWFDNLLVLPINKKLSTVSSIAINITVLLYWNFQQRWNCHSKEEAWNEAYLDSMYPVSLQSKFLVKNFISSLLGVGRLE